VTRVTPPGRPSFGTNVADRLSATEGMSGSRDTGRVRPTVIRPAAGCIAPEAARSVDVRGVAAVD